MAQIKFRADIDTAEFPLLTDWAGRTALAPSAGEQQKPQPVSTPQILFARNVLPTAQGFKSVSFGNLVPAASPANLDFTDIETVTDPAQNRALVGITADSKIYLLTAASYVWVDVTPGGWGGGSKVTFGYVNGDTYLYLSQFGCYRVDITGIALVATTLTALVPTNILGIASAVNYLLAYDNTTVYWGGTDSATSTDFTHSAITGAGSATPFDIAGKIAAIKQLNNGFAIYTTINIILASFSNNTLYPWVFRQANGSSGLVSGSQVAGNRESGFHIALTYAGMLQVTPQGCTQITPEVADFLAAKIYESWNAGTNSIDSTALSSNLITRLALLGSRYVVVSYGISTLTDCLIYDLALKKYGTVSLTHVQCFEIETGTEPPIATYAADAGTYAAASPQPYVDTSAGFNSPPVLGGNIGFLLADGSTIECRLDYAATTGDAVLLLGKYQAVRSNMLELEEIEVESIPTANTGFSLKVLPSINGKDYGIAVSPAVVGGSSSGVGLRHYKIRCIAKNHTLVFLGSFNLTSVEITATLGGHR